MTSITVLDPDTVCAEGQDPILPYAVLVDVDDEQDGETVTLRLSADAAEKLMQEIDEALAASRRKGATDDDAPHDRRKEDL